MLPVTGSSCSGSFFPLFPRFLFTPTGLVIGGVSLSAVACFLFASELFAPPWSTFASPCSSLDCKAASATGRGTPGSLCQAASYAHLSHRGAAWNRSAHFFSYLLLSTVPSANMGTKCKLYFTIQSLLHEGRNSCANIHLPEAFRKGDRKPPCKGLLTQVADPP